MSRDIKQLVVIWSLAFISGAVVFIGYHNWTRPIHHNAQLCPGGSYSIGDGLCKPEPTGCPYGDSIALDSGKCEAPANVNQSNDFVYIPPADVNEIGGK